MVVSRTFSSVFRQKMSDLTRNWEHGYMSFCEYSVLHLASYLRGQEKEREKEEEEEIDSTLSF